MKSSVCFCFLFTIQTQTFPWWIPETYFPPIPSEEYFPNQKQLLRKWKYEKRHTKIKARSLCAVKRRWEDFLLFLEGKTDKLRIEQMSSKVTSLVFLFWGDVTGEALFPFVQDGASSISEGCDGFLYSNNAVSQLLATGCTCGLTTED